MSGKGLSWTKAKRTYVLLEITLLYPKKGVLLCVNSGHYVITITSVIYL